jgi:hypothetical protein
MVVIRIGRRKLCNDAPDGRSGWRIEDADENGVKRIRGNDGNSGTLG